MKNNDANERQFQVRIASFSKMRPRYYGKFDFLYSPGVLEVKALNIRLKEALLEKPDSKAMANKVL